MKRVLTALRRFDLKSASGCLEPADHFYAGSRENILFVRRVGKLGGEILPREVELLVQVGAPFGAIGHIIDNSTKSD